MKKLLLTFALVLCVMAVVFAQAPYKFSYQAVVRDFGNNLICNHAVGVQISILQGDINGTIVYRESQNLETNSNGLMTLQIGAGTVINGDMSAIDWSNGPYFLKTETDPTGGTNYTIEGTQQLLSVPYALYAESAANSFSGNYNDLTNRPELFSGDYNDLTNRPTIPSVPTNVSEFTNDASYVNNANCENVSFCDLLNMLTALQNMVDSLANVVARNNPPIEEPCTPTSSTHNIEITTNQLPYAFGDTTFLAGTETGTYVLLRTNAGGCDSTITINLTINEPAPSFTCGTSTITDVDGNTYNTVLIGEQCWMKENLKTTKYADNTPIENGNTPSIDVAYWYYPDSVETNKATYGLLYNWKAVMGNATASEANPSGVQGICPTGWHVPSDAEWIQLTEYVSSESSYCCDGNASNIAKALASTELWNIHWTSCTVGKTPSDNNATGFSALPAGQYSYNGNYNSLGTYANFWSTTGAIYNNVYYFYLSYHTTSVSRTFESRMCGFSVRCVRDVEE